MKPIFKLKCDFSGYPMDFLQLNFYLSRIWAPNIVKSHGDNAYHEHDRAISTIETKKNQYLLLF